MTEAYHANSTGGASDDDQGAAAALGIASGYVSRLRRPSQSWRW
jgi:hypothetical protein